MTDLRNHDAMDLNGVVVTFGLDETSNNRQSNSIDTVHPIMLGLVSKDGIDIWMDHKVRINIQQDILVLLLPSSGLIHETALIAVSDPSIVSMV